MEIKIGFVGLGHMGHPMALNLIKAGYRVTVFDLQDEAKKSLAAAGAKEALTLKDDFKDVDMVFTMLQTGQQVSQVCNELFLSAKKNTLFIDSSSINIQDSKELHQQAVKNQMVMLDAPVSGGVAGAQAATLTIMVGGEEANFLRAKPILEKLGKKIVYAGAAGSGQAAKICNNLILGISMIAVSEGFVLAKKLGLDPKKFFEISSNASGQCWSMTSYCPEPDIVPQSPANKNYAAGFAAKMMLKDLRLAQQAAEYVSASTPLGAEATELYNLFVQQGHGELDFSAIINFINGADRNF